jgi:nucleotide-binding universal stress UspA family protein
MERILIAVDFSECSRVALRYGLELARSFHAAVKVVYVVPGVAYELGWAEYVALMNLDDTTLARELEAMVREEWTGPEAELQQIEHRVLQGVEYREILAEAEHWGATLIVVGSHGRSTLGRWFLGSVSSRVFAKAKVSVLVVAGAVRPPKELLVAVDLGASFEGVLRGAIGWSSALGSSLSVLHVMDSLPEPVAERLKLGPELQRFHDSREGEMQAAFEIGVRKILPQGLLPPLLLAAGRVYQEICRRAEEGRYDLIVVGPHEKHGLLDIGNTAIRVAHHSPCPILIVRPAPVADPLEA